MSRLLLDTSAYSALFRGHAGVIVALQSAEAVYLNPIVIGELRSGFRRGDRRRQNEDEIDAFLQKPHTETVPIDTETAERYAVIVSSLRAAGTMVSTNDAWIAASAMQHGLTVLTTDADFLRIPQILVDHHPAS
jgi:predicted nucleic acid-binding protein